MYTDLGCSGALRCINVNNDPVLVTRIHGSHCIPSFLLLFDEALSHTLVALVLLEYTDLNVKSPDVCTNHTWTNLEAQGVSSCPENSTHGHTYCLNPPLSFVMNDQTEELADHTSINIDPILGPSSQGPMETDFLKKPSLIFIQHAFSIWRANNHCS